MKRINLEPEYVVSKVLEQEGYDAPVELVKDWIAGDAIPPPDILPVITAVLNNLPHHIRSLQARALFNGKDIAEQAAAKAFRTPAHDIRRVTNDRDAKLYGQESWKPTTIYLPKRSHDAFISMARAMKVPRTHLLQEILKNAIEMTMEAAHQDPTEESEEGCKVTFHKYKKAKSKQAVINRTIRHVKKLKKEVASDE